MSARHAYPRRLALLLGVSLLVASAPASAGTSGGKGGAVGTTRVDWPCKGCSVEVPAGLDQTKGTKLLVALHGDEGTAGPIFGAFSPELQKATDFILFAPQCPLESTCTDGKWWHTGPPTPDWLNQQVAQIEAEYNVDYDHEHLTGISGGAIYISAILAYLYPDMYATGNLISGGIKPSIAKCPACVMPLSFVEGDQDFEYTLGYTPATRDYFTACGGVVEFDLRPGLDHQGAANYAIAEIPTILNWFRAHPNGCATRRGISGEVDAGSAGDAAPVRDAAVVHGDAGSHFETDGASTSTLTADKPPASAAVTPAGCGCRTTRSGSDGSVGWLALLALIAMCQGARRLR